MGKIGPCRIWGGLEGRKVTLRIEAVVRGSKTGFRSRSIGVPELLSEEVKKKIKQGGEIVPGSYLKGTGSVIPVIVSWGLRSWWNENRRPS